MPSKGSRVVTMRIAEPLMSRILEVIERNNKSRFEGEWDLSGWILDAIRDKIAHQDRAMVQRLKRKRKLHKPFA